MGKPAIDMNVIRAMSVRQLAEWALATEEPCLFWFLCGAVGAALKDHNLAAKLYPPVTLSGQIASNNDSAVAFLKSLLLVTDAPSGSEDGSRQTKKESH